MDSFCSKALHFEICSFIPAGLPKFVGEVSLASLLFSYRNRKYEVQGKTCRLMNKENGTQPKLKSIFSRY